MVWCDFQKRSPARASKMTFAIVILAVSIAVIAGFSLDRFNRWWGPRRLDRMMTKWKSDIEKGVAEPPRLVPECHYVVRVEEVRVSCTDPQGQVESVEWEDVQKVEIVTTDTGPALPDVFWVLHGSATGCVIPQGATGEQELLDRLFKLPKFDLKNMIAAMACTENQRFVCWERVSD